MKLLLKDFQSEHVAELVRRLRQAARGARDGDAEAVSLSAPTGSGKTVIATATIELILTGDDRAAPQPDATFLWITDQPELNEQTRRKMLAASSVLSPAGLVVIDTSFDQETFTPGVVYFLNTQKLGRNSGLVTSGDKRTYTIWDTIRNTADQRPTRFYLFIDEAHRGMAESPRARDEASTIIQKFIKGAPEVPAVLLVIGISATPERFHKLLAGQEPARTFRSVVVKPEDVRDSGLLKERITLYHPTQDQPSDVTMLRAAARSWQGFVRRWSDYCDAEVELRVRPLLVVQVQDGAGKQLSRTDIGAAMRDLEDEIGPLPGDAFAHAFQEGVSLTVGGRELRYLAPADIDQDPDVQVVFFKTSLNTGWDCPRAEVMMSFRTAVDATAIAQLVGRVVRTPLARRIESDDHLNSVALYLPHYDERGLSRVIDQLTAPDPHILPPVELERGEEIVTLRRAESVDTAVEALQRLPSYVIPKTRKTSDVRRLMKLGRLLAHDDIRPDAPEAATDIILRVLRAEYGRLKDTGQFRNVVEQQGQLDVRAVNWQVHGHLDDEAEIVQLDMAAENLDDLFDAAGRRIGEGLHKAWWRARVEEDRTAKTTAKLEFFALCADDAVLNKVESVAQQTVQSWLKEHQVTIAGLAEGHRQAYDEIRRLAAYPEPSPIQYPNTIESKRAEQSWARHLYVDDRGAFPSKFNGWEVRVIEDELARSDLVTWLRNPDRKPWSLCVPYLRDGEWQPLYPDFLVVRETPSGLVADLLDPHAISLADAPAKAAGLALYAAKHAHEFGRIELIIVDGDQLRRLDLTDQRVRDQVKAVSTHAHLRQLFAAAL